MSDKIGIVPWWRRFKTKRPITTALTIIAAGLFIRLVLWGGFDSLFDYVLYPLAVINYGPVLGTGVMTIASAIVCLALIWLYDLAKADVLLLEQEKEIVKKAVGSNYGEYARKSKLRALVSIIVWPILTDPFLTVVRLRGPGIHKMTAREWEIFSVSVLVANIGWGAWISFWVWLAEVLAPRLELVSPWVLYGLLALVGSIVYCRPWHDRTK